MPGRTIIFSLCAMLVAPALGSAQTRAPGYELADAYFRKGNFASAYLTALPQAHAGDARAQYMLGLMSFHGLGPVARDRLEAARWFAQAAENGNGDAQYALAQAFAGGDGVSTDKPRSMQWLERAAETGQTAAIMSLARLLDEGIELPADRAGATNWVRRAAELGDTRAQFMLGERIANGVGSPKDPVAGNQWIRRAAERGEPLALLKLARDILEDESTPPADVIEAHAFAAFAEERALGDTKKLATTLKSDLAQRLTPTDIVTAGERLQTLRAKRS